MYQVGQKYFSVGSKVTINVIKILKDYIDCEDYVKVTESGRNGHYTLSYRDMDRMIASGRLKPLNDFTPIKCLYNQPKIWLSDTDCVSL